MQMQKSRTDSLTHLIRLVDNSPGQRLSFRDFMAACLYDEQHGYYNQNTVKIGKDGDFYTSSSIGRIMGMMLAQAIQRIIREEGWDDGLWQIAEWGGGTGRLALHILDHLSKEEPQLYEQLTYTIIDRSPFHRTLQGDMLGQHRNVRFHEPDEWLAEQHAIPTIVCSNELLDAFPVHRIRFMDGRFEEVFVNWDEPNEIFRETYSPITDIELLKYIEDEQLPSRERQQFEVNLEAQHWIRAAAAHLNPGVLLTVDYGDTREELYGPHRMHGTLMCYRKHQAHDNPYVHVGEQDITAHVNFSACIRAGEEVGLLRWTLETQREFLVESGILERLQAHDGTDPFGAEARNNRAIRQLLMSDQMSELFKVLIQRKNKR
jgi:SAM-dependent MidA family methyltransferase